MSDPEILGQCLVEGDPARVGRSRSLRSKALLLSIGVEAMFLAALLLAPLATPSTLPRRLDWTPAPPYRGVTRLELNPAAAHPITPVRHTDYTTPIFRPIRTPTTAPDTAVPDEGEVDASSNAGTGPIGPGSGPGVPFGADSGPLTPQPMLPPIVPPQPKIIHKSEGAQSALLEHRVVPVYPPLAVQTRTQGEVKLHAIIATDGTIKSLEVESGNPLLILAARSAVEQWRYKPALLNGQPVEVDTFITVIFRLSR